MWTCRICRFETEIDDVVVTNGRRICICVRCFVRETGSVRPMTASLRRDVSAALATLEAA